MSGTTGYPWVDGQFLKAADLNAAIAGSSGGTGAVSSVGAIAIAFGGAPPADVNAVLALDPTTLVLYVRIGSGWSPAGRLVSLTASPLATSVPFGWSFTTSGHVLVPTSAPTTVPTTSPSALSALSATGPTGARGQAASADGLSALVSIPAPGSSGQASATPAPTSPPSVATVLTVDTPPFVAPNGQVVVTGTMQGTAAALRYNTGSGWQAVASPTITGNVGYSFTLTAPSTVGVYTLQVGDANAAGVIASSGDWLVTDNSFATPSVMPTWAFDPNRASLVALDANGNATAIASALDASKTLSAVTQTNLIPYSRGVGADGKRRMPVLTATRIDDTLNDPLANFFDAGAANGPNAALIAMLNTSDVRTGNWTLCFGAHIDVSGTYSYEGGPIWGAWGSSVQYISAARYHPDSATPISSQIRDSLGTTSEAWETAPGTSQWCVFTARKTGNSLALRVNGTQVASTTITSSGSFTAADFMWGGSFVTGMSSGTGNGYPGGIPGFAFYPDALSESDMEIVEDLVRNTAGMPVISDPVAPMALSGQPSSGTVSGKAQASADDNLSSIAALAAPASAGQARADDNLSASAAIAAPSSSGQATP